MTFGLLGIRERARQPGGFVLIDTAPGTGFRLAVHVPLSVIRASEPGVS